MSPLVERARKALTENRARTDPGHDDPRLRGRTYAVPFDRVWSEALRIARGRWGWTVIHHDDMEGVIRVEAKTPVFRFVDDVEIRIRLDQEAQTRVDMRSWSRKGTGDLGTNARRVARFFRHLDRALR